MINLKEMFSFIVNIKEMCGIPIYDSWEYQLGIVVSDRGIKALEVVGDAQELLHFSVVLRFDFLNGRSETKLSLPEYYLNYNRCQ